MKKALALVAVCASLVAPSVCAAEMPPEWELIEKCGFRIVLGDLSDSVVGYRKVVFSDSLAWEDKFDGSRLVRTWHGPHPLLAATLCNWTREAQTYDLRTPDISARGTIPPRSWKRINRETR